jgi:hypothetical protein
MLVSVSGYLITSVAANKLPLPLEAEYQWWYQYYFATERGRLGVSVATSGDVRDQPRVADAASALLQDVFGRDKNPCRLVYGVASLPLGTPVELEVIFEVAGQARLASFP